MEDKLLIDLEYKIAAVHFRNFNTRIQKACNKAGIVTVGDLVSMSEGCFAAHGSIGQGTKTTINDFLAKHGLRFGMSDKEIHAYRVRYIEQDQEQKRLSLPPGASVWEEKILGLSQQIFKDLDLLAAGEVGGLHAAAVGRGNIGDKNGAVPCHLGRAA